MKIAKCNAPSDFCKHFESDKEETTCVYRLPDGLCVSEDMIKEVNKAENPPRGEK